MYGYQVEGVSTSLVREYLSRKGLRSTLQVLDEECPRTEGSVNNRSDLMGALHIEKLMTKNKTSQQPLSTVLEVIVRYFFDQHDTEQHLTPSVAPLVDATTSRETQQTPGRVRSAKLRRNGSGQGSNDSSSHDMVLEDTLDESETRLGNGKLNLLSSSSSAIAVTSDVAVSRQRSSRHLAGPTSTGLQDRDRIRSGRDRGLHKPKVVRDKEDKHSSSLGNIEALSSVGVTDIPAVTTRGRGSSSDILAALERGIRQRADAQPSRHVSTNSSPLDCTYDAKLSSISGDIPLRRPNTSLTEDPTKILGTKSSKGTQKSATKTVSKTAARMKTKSKQSSIEIDDIEDDDDSGNEDSDIRQMLLSRQPIHQPITAVDSESIDMKTAMELKKLILGGACEQFNAEWRQQSFGFCDYPELQYGIVQKKGGACGILAAVQASVLQELLFSDSPHSSAHPLSPSRSCRSAALATALAKTFWRAASLSKKAVVALSSHKVQIECSSRYKADGLTEMLILNNFDNYADLLVFVKQNIGQFEMDGSCGVILVLYSVVLSRTIKGIKEDMDEPSNKLMGAHGYCTQEMVNVLLGGRARSNVFNDIIELDEGSVNVTVLKGIDERSDIGFLSLFEHYQSCQVGTYLKTPKLPIWVVCSESHFSVLFCLKKELLTDWKAERRFDLIYYDGLARQTEPVVLTVSTTNRQYVAPSSDQLVPPLELCIRTKWPGAEIDWNGTEPLL